nr:baculoviral IAP repeat-containing protein 6-like [Camelus dromedarius]
MVTGGGAAPPRTVTEPLPSVIVLSAGRKMAAAAAAASGPGCSSAAGAGAAGVSEWLVLRDGCMRCDADGLHSLSYHPALNAILAVTSRGTIKVIDGTSGATLQASALSGECAARRAGTGPCAGGGRQGGKPPSPGARPPEEGSGVTGGGGGGQGWGLGPGSEGRPGS